MDRFTAKVSTNLILKKIFLWINSIKFLLVLLKEQPIIKTNISDEFSTFKSRWDGSYTSLSFWRYFFLTTFVLLIRHLS